MKKLEKLTKRNEEGKKETQNLFIFKTFLF